MSEDDSTRAPEGAAKPQEKAPEKRRSWFSRLTAAISGEPDNQDDLVELLRDVQADGVIDADTLRIMEGAVAISDLSVGDIMIPRAHMVALPHTFAECKVVCHKKCREFVPNHCGMSPAMIRAMTMEQSSVWHVLCRAA